MLNNKGFAVSAVLYTTLIAFLLFLAVVLSMFSSSSDLVRNANTDLINGNKFEAKQVRLTSAWKNSRNQTKKDCQPIAGTNVGTNYYYYYESPIIVKINSRYGTYYWPKDFNITDKNDVSKTIDAYSGTLISYSTSTYTYNGKVTSGKSSEPSTDNKIKAIVNTSDSSKLKIKFEDTLLNQNTDEIELSDLCS